MITKKLGRTGLEVTPLGYGSMGLRGPRTWGVRVVSDEDADRFLNAVLDAGINFVDTAPDYGVSEERIGRYISSRRAEFYLATCNSEHLAENLAAAARGPLPSDLYEEIRSRIAVPHPTGIKPLRYAAH